MGYNITHKILATISSAAMQRGLSSTLMCDDGEWSLYIYDTSDSIRINRDTKISVIEDWMQEQGESQ